MRGGQPGFYPDIKGKCNGQIGINLYDPFGFGFRDKPADKRARGLKSEILNGRAAMFGIMGFLRRVQGAGLGPDPHEDAKGFHYDGDVAAPFAENPSTSTKLPLAKAGAVWAATSKTAAGGAGLAVGT